jgi:hypothetical protein
LVDRVQFFFVAMAVVGGVGFVTAVVCLMWFGN